MLHPARLDGQVAQEGHLVNGAVGFENQAQPMPALDEPFGVDQHRELLPADGRTRFCDQDVHVVETAAFFCMLSRTAWTTRSSFTPERQASGMV